MGCVAGISISSSLFLFLLFCPLELSFWRFSQPPVCVCLKKPLVPLWLVQPQNKFVEHISVTTYQMWNTTLSVSLIYIISKCYVKQISLNSHVRGVIPPIPKIQTPLVFSVCSEGVSSGENRWSFVLSPCNFFFSPVCLTPCDWFSWDKGLSLFYWCWTVLSAHTQSIWKGNQWERFG